MDIYCEWRKGSSHDADLRIEVVSIQPVGILDHIFVVYALTPFVTANDVAYDSRLGSGSPHGHISSPICEGGEGRTICVVCRLVAPVVR